MLRHFAVFVLFTSFSMTIHGEEKILFNRDIRPILSDACFQCHGPDQNKRKADLRLDQQDSVFSKDHDVPLIVPKHPDKSELYRRLTTTKRSEQMPPRRAKRQLTSKEISLIKQWIEQGAGWQKHWAFIAPQRPPLPKVLHPSQVRNGIDRFILARLENEKWTLSPDAEKTTLLRRVSLALTGLPPTPSEVNAFLNDDSPDAYEHVVDRLLNSPRFGEHFAARWLDAARYADTNGYQSDGNRTMWRYRDQVIEAFNHNMPFDQFTIEQIAGDMLPNATLEQQILSGFNRNHRGNAEGGVIAEEYAVEYVVDRVDTTATVWLGLTLACARCHDHKYDPISQKEFYQVFAYFNNVPERGKAVKFGNSPPMIKAPTRQQQEQLQRLDNALKKANHSFATHEKELAKSQRQWESTIEQPLETDWTWTKRQLAHYHLDEAKHRAKGKINHAANFEKNNAIKVGNVGDFNYQDKFTLSAWVRPRSVENGLILSRMSNSVRTVEGYALQLDNGHVQLNLVKRWLDDSIRVETKATLKPNQWTHILATYDGSRWASGIQIYFNGQRQPLKINLDELNQDFKTKQPFRIGGGIEASKSFDGLIDEVRIYADAVTVEQAQWIATAASINQILSIPDDKRTPAQRAKLRAYFVRHHAPQSLQQLAKRIEQLRERRNQLIESFPSTMVMQEMPTPRETFILNRGQYDKPGERVYPDTPNILPPLPKDAPNNRLGFAKWLVDKRNPLTARILVNRYWQMMFGTGLVKTVEDFGVQGEWPTHPELLDWLATEFMRTNWNIKKLLRLMVTSSTFRQSSRVTQEYLELDPENRLLARGPRLRLSAETIRDQALFASGLLIEQVGGPSVKPYQPSGLWEELSGKVYKQAAGSGLYRRSLYTFWKRTIVPPTMKVFDSSMRESCRVRQPRTNTPLQALALMNDVTFVEASRALAERAMKHSSATKARLTYAFQLATGRHPRVEELSILQAGYQRHWQHYQRNANAAKKLIHSGASKPDVALNQAELAALTTIAGLILNLDELIVRE